MNGLFEAAQEVGTFLAGRGWRFCLIGGLAVQQWGEPRATLDVDLALLTGLGDEETYASGILERFPGRIQDALTFAITRRVLLVRASNGKEVDISLAALPFEAGMIERSVPVQLGPGVVLPCCTAEDLFIMKAFASRPRDWLDAESIVARGAALDQPYILAHLRELSEMKEEPEILVKAERILRKTP